MPTIREYDYTVTGSRLLDPNKMYYGVELEYALNSDIPDVLNVVMEPLKQAAEKVSIPGYPAVWKSDMSIHTEAGFHVPAELVSVPLSEEEVYILYRDFFTSDITRRNVRTGSNTGMHVHVSRSALSPEEMIYIRSLFMVRTGLTPLFEFLGNRPLGTYCRPVYNPLATVASYDYDRREAVSVSNDNPTFEFRLFKSTVSLFDFAVNMELVKAIIDYTKARKDKFHDRIRTLDRAASKEDIFEKLNALVDEADFIGYLKKNTDLVSFKLEGY